MTHNWFEPAEIRQRRQELSLSQQRLAELSGLSLRTIVRLERGENTRGGTAYTLDCVARALQVAASELAHDSTRSNEPVSEKGGISDGQ